MLIGVSALLLALPKKPLPVEGDSSSRLSSGGHAVSSGESEPAGETGTTAGGAATPGQLRRRDEKDDLRPDPGHSRPAGAVGGEQTHR